LVLLARELLFLLDGRVAVRLIHTVRLQVPQPDLLIVGTTGELVNVLQIDEAEDDITHEPGSPLTNVHDVLLLLSFFVLVLCFFQSGLVCTLQFLASCGQLLCELIAE